MIIDGMGYEMGNILDRGVVMECVGFIYLLIYNTYNINQLMLETLVFY